MFVEGEAVHSDEWFHLSQQESSATACRIMKEPFGVSKNGFELSIDDTDAFDGGSSILVRASGAAAAVVEMAQQASWLGKLLACEEFVLFDFRGHPVKIEESLYATYTVCVSELDIWLVLELSDSRTLVICSFSFLFRRCFGSLDECERKVGSMEPPSLLRVCQRNATGECGLCQAVADCFAHEAGPT